MNDPYFRFGAYKVYLHAFAKALSLTGDFDCRFLLNKHIYAKLQTEAVGSSFHQQNCFIVDANDTARIGLQEFMTASYRGIGEALDATAFLQGLLHNWQPDIIICWEAPTYAFRTCYPKALVLDAMPSIFARPPYPRAISIDPIGLYRDCWFSPNNLTSLSAEDDQIDLYKNVREAFSSHFGSLRSHELFSTLLKLPQAKSVGLVPLQISDYFGFRDNCEFHNQFAFLEAASRASDEDILVTTQYVGGFVSERAINAESLKYLQNNIKDIRYSWDFEKLDSVSQFIIPWIDTVYSVSSTLGLQAKFYGKKLVSPSTSHLRYIADQVTFSSKAHEHHPLDPDLFFANYLGRGILLFDQVSADPGYFASIVRDMLDRKAHGATGVEVLPSAKAVGASTEKFLTHSKFGPSERNFRKLFPVEGSVQENVLPSSIDTAISSSSVEVVSFDVFDTLVRRTVYKPEDVFVLMERELVRHHSDSYPSFFLRRFAELRAAAERLVRATRDKHLLGQDIFLTEEITIKEVYEELAALLKLELPIDKLIDIEQQIELSVLRPRRIGQLMYAHAQSRGKRIIISSDFIHPYDFIERVLKQCGYEGYERLFLSSDTGNKKHSGELFKTILQELDVNPGGIIHVGDNPIGDVQKAREHSMRAMLVPSGRALFKEALLKRKVSERVLDSSFFLRTISSLFADTYLYGNHPRHKALETGSNDAGFELISSKEELGFLAIGPIAMSFANWILDQAREKNISQIVFFARDCLLPYKMCAEISKARGHDDLTLVYAPTSRRSVTGLDLFHPNDVLNVRIDDFSPAASVGQLLSERFLIAGDEVESDILKSWGVDSLLAEKRSVPLAALYGLVLDIVNRNWTVLASRYEDRRGNFKSYLREHSLIDFSKPTLAVDLGYQGSIHRKVSPLFTPEPEPLFFMSYSNGFGEDPIQGAKAFYAENCNPHARSNIGITHNLLLETLMNEAQGSVSDIVKLTSGSCEVVRDGSLPEGHSQTIDEIHNGAMKLCKAWLLDCSGLEAASRAEKDSITYFFSLLARTPTLTEVKLLQSLVFDNAFAGVPNIPIVAFDGTKQLTEKILWPEAAAIMKRTEVPPQKSAPTVEPGVKPEQVKRGANKPTPASASKVGGSKANGSTIVPVSSDLEKGRQAYHAGRYVEAANSFVKHSQTQTGHAEAHRSAAEAFDRIGNIAEARRHIMLAGDLLPNNKNLQRRIKELHQNSLMRRLAKECRFDIPKPRETAKHFS